MNHMSFKVGSALAVLLGLALSSGAQAAALSVEGRVFTTACRYWHSTQADLRWELTGVPSSYQGVELVTGVSLSELSSSQPALPWQESKIVPFRREGSGQWVMESLRLVLRDRSSREVKSLQFMLRAIDAQGRLVYLKGDEDRSQFGSFALDSRTDAGQSFPCIDQESDLPTVPLQAFYWERLSQR